jgi:hypothetical protein
VGDDLRVTGLRGLLWRLFALLASVLLPVALSSAWLATVVTDSDSYVDTVGPLASDPTVQEAVADRMEGLALDSVEERAGGTLGSERREGVGAVVQQVVKSAEFEAVWRTANRSAHRQAVRVLEGEEDRLVESDGLVSVELGAVYTDVVQLLDQRGLVDAATVPEVEATVPLARAADLRRVQRVYELLDAAGFWLPAIWLVLAVASLLVAPDRRRALRWLAWGTIGGLLLLVACLLLIRATVLSELGSSGDDELVRAIWDVLVARLYWAIGVGFLIAVGVLVLAAVLGRRRRRAPAPGPTDPSMAGER